MPKITKRVVDSLRTDRSGKDVSVWDAGDGALKGFGIRLKPSGVGSFLIQYRNAEGRTRRMVVGKIGTLTAEEARVIARDKLAAATKGADPSAERRAVRGATTVSELCDLYLANADGRIKASTLAMDRSRITTHVKPLIGRLTVRSLTAADIERMKTDIIAGKTAAPRKKEGRGGVATGGVGVASRTLGMVATILEYSIKPLQIIKDNPARGVRKPADGKQRRFLTLEEIGKLTSDAQRGGRGRRRNRARRRPTALADRLSANGSARPSACMGRHACALRPVNGIQVGLPASPCWRGGTETPGRDSGARGQSLGLSGRTGQRTFRRLAEGARPALRQGKAGWRDGSRPAPQFRCDGGRNGLFRADHRGSLGAFGSRRYRPLCPCPGLGARVSRRPRIG